MKSKKELFSNLEADLFMILKARFDHNMNRHKNIAWQDVEDKIVGNPKKLLALRAMETTGGEPDVIGYVQKTNEYIFCDCSEESPNGRRSICYDRSAQVSRKEAKPRTNAIDMAAEIGIEILSETQYMELQKLGKFDQKTSSWIKTPDTIRQLGGAIFADRRYDHVFVYHNGAESYYAARGFRGRLQV